MLLLGLGGLLLASPPARAQARPALPGDTLPLDFLGFRAGVTLTALNDLATQNGKGTLSCQRSDQDSRLGECRGGLPELDAGRSVDLWASIIDGRTAITTLESQLSEARFARWRALLEGRYGPAAERHQGPMTVLQWVRRGQMLRLSWRSKGRDVEASVSLIDGALLDGWANQGKKPRGES